MLYLPLFRGAGELNIKLFLKGANVMIVLKKLVRPAQVLMKKY